MKKLILMAASALLLMTQCRKSEVSPAAPDGNTLSMTVTVNQGRTDITTGGAIKWSEGDMIHVSLVNDDETCTYLGALGITYGVGETTGVFSGTLDLDKLNLGDVEHDFQFYYLGAGNNKKLNEGTATISFKDQFIYKDGEKLVNAARHHVGYGVAKGTVKDHVLNFGVTLTSQVAMAHFKFNKTEGGEVYQGPIMISGDGIYSAMTVDLTKSGFIYTTPEKEGDEGTIALAAGPADRYVMLVPQQKGKVSPVVMSFKYAAENPAVFSFGNGIEANKFYRMGEGPIALNVSEEDYVTIGDLQWFKFNLGATCRETRKSWYGEYYAWGEVEPYYVMQEPLVWKKGKEIGYDWQCYSGTSDFTEWNPKPYDENGCLYPEHDAASVVMGNRWRMPFGSGTETESENEFAVFKDLMSSYSFKGYEGGPQLSEELRGIEVAPSGDSNKSLFLPAEGYRDKVTTTSLYYGFYWSRTRSTNDAYRAYLCQFIDKVTINGSNIGRCRGFALRPVRDVE